MIFQENRESADINSKALKDRKLLLLIEYDRYQFS